MNKAVFIDKDGTLIEDIPYNVDPGVVKFTVGAVNALKKLKRSGYLLILVSNQSGIAHGYFDEPALENMKFNLQEKLRLSNIELDAFYFCPHHPKGKIPKYAIVCECRKPKSGMILDAAKSHNIDLSRSWMIGDILNDVEAGNTAGCQTILIDNGNETEWLTSPMRTPTATAPDLGVAAEKIIHH